ncbi:uncharacterized protein [Antedon mediterranea]|uniref:uncharacterized protein n=1 Tax=Antedon mediterranea TaxID=105859 RepID=UPI003AF805AB
MYKFDEIKMANNVDANSHTQMVDSTDKQCYDTPVDIFQNDDNSNDKEKIFDNEDVDGFDVGDEFDEEFMDGLVETGAGNQKGEATNESLEDNLGTSSGNDQEGTTLESTMDETTHESEEYEEVEEWEEVTEEVTDDEEEGESDDEDEEDNEDEASPEDQSQLGACGYESDEDAERCYICLLTFRDQELGTPESCDHTFCLECIQEWSKHVNTCPVDRTVFHCILVRSIVGGPIERNIEVATCNKQEEEEDESVTYCEVCGRCDREDRLLLCDGCDNGYHLECLDPPLEHIPIEEWYCPECTPSCLDPVEQQKQCEVKVEEEDKPDTTSRSTMETRNSQIYQGIPRVIARTRVSERVVTQISKARALRLREEDVNEASGSLTKKETRLPRVQMKRKKKATSKKVKKKGSKKKKGKKLRRTVKRKVKRLQPVTVKTRIAGKLGLVKPRAGSLLPGRKVRLEPSLDNQRAGIGAAKLNIFGGNDLTEISNVSNTSETLSSFKSTSSNQESSVDVLSSIMQGQELLHTKSENVTIHRDGTLSANPLSKESSLRKRKRTSTSSEGDVKSGILNESPDKNTYNVSLPPEVKFNVDTSKYCETNLEHSEDSDDDSNDVKPHNFLETKGKRAAARELANIRAAEREEEVRSMKEQRQLEEELNDEIEWDIQTPFSVTHKAKDDSKVKDINGTKDNEKEEEEDEDEIVEEEAQWVEVVKKKDEEQEETEKQNLQVKKDENSKSTQNERAGKEHREGTLTCRASTSSFESHSETDERKSRKSVDDKKKKSSKHGKSKRSHTSGSTRDSSAEEGEVKSDEETKGRKLPKKKTKKAKHSHDRDTRNVVVNEHHNVSDLSKVPKNQDSRRIEDRDRYDRGSGYNDLRHVIQVKRNYDNPRYEMYWDDYNRKWVEYHPEWSATWEQQHRNYEQAFAADWQRQNSAGSQRYLKERSWENFTVKRERSPIFDRRKSREKASMDKRDVGWETNSDRRNRDTREKDKKDNKQERKRYSHSQTTTRSNSSGADSQRREKSLDKNKDRDHDRNRKDKSRNETTNQKDISRSSSRTNGRDKNSKLDATPQVHKSDRTNKEQRKSKDIVKSEKSINNEKKVERNERIKGNNNENRKSEGKSKERTKENIDFSSKSTKTELSDKKKKKKEKPIKGKVKKEKKEKDKKVKKKKEVISDVKETTRTDKKEELERKKMNDIDKREVASLKAKIDAIAFKQQTHKKAEIKEVIPPPVQNSVKKCNDKESSPPHVTVVDKKTKEPAQTFEQSVDKVDEPYDPFEPTASPSLTSSSPCSSFQTHSPPPNSKRKLSSDFGSLNNSTDSAFEAVKRPKVETGIKSSPDGTKDKPVTKPFNDILPQLVTQDGSKLNQLIDTFVNKSGKATLDSKETDAEKALPGSSKFASTANKDFKSIFNAPSPNESDAEFEFNDEEDIESSAVELQNKNSRERYLKKLHHQERVVEEVKLAIKPYYQRKEIDKNDYKEILKRSVNQVCHSKSGEINPVKIRRLIDGYVKKFQLKKKHVDKDVKQKKKQPEVKKKR